MANKTKTIICRVTEKEYKKINKYAKDQDITLSEAVRQLFAEKLFYYEDKKGISTEQASAVAGA